MQYNSEKEKLIMREYGRGVQSMVQLAVAESDPEKKKRMVKNILDTMGILNPSLRNQEDYKEKLWDHLHIISDFKLEVEGPFPTPNKDDFFRKPDHPGYPDYKIRYRNYGKFLLNFVAKVKSIEDEQKKEHATRMLANYMKIVHANWNKEVVSDEMIRADIHMISGGILTLGDHQQLQRTWVQRPQNNKFKSRKPNRNNNNGGGGMGNHKRRKFNNGK